MATCGLVRLARPICVLAFLLVSFPIGSADAQPIADPNVNMVRGTNGVNGDPYLQRQNEGSLAISSRNPCHLLAGGNDYRTVDIPDPSALPGIEPSFAGDAWLGLYTSTDCGAKWQSTLMPGYPQDTSAAGLASPLRGFEAAADAVVRSGPNGLFYYAGMAFNRVKDTTSQIFAARLIDNNNKERGNPIEYKDATVLDKGTSGQFLDKPWLAVDVPRAAYGPGAAVWAVSDSGEHVNPNAAAGPDAVAMCRIETRLDNGDLYTQEFPAGNAYMAWARFTGEGTPNPAKLMFARTTDCGRTWQAKPISDNQLTSQGATIAIAPHNGNVYVAWRQFGKNGRPHAIYLSHSTDGGKTFSKPRAVIPAFLPFDQAKTSGRFRTNSLPTIAADDQGRVYVAVSARGYADVFIENSDGTTTRRDDARVVIAVSTDGGLTFGPPGVAEEPHREGHQVMPSLTYTAGKLQLVYYDFRDDKSQVFKSLVDDNDIIVPPDTVAYRHTVEVIAAQAEPADVLVFTALQISSYRSALMKDPASGAVRRVTQLNPANLPLYQCQDDVANCRPFIGDYIDVAGLNVVPAPSGAGGWIANMPSLFPGSSGSQSTGPFAPLPIFHAAWTDNRDVRAPSDGVSWHQYRAPGKGGFPMDGTLPNCSTAGMRNQNLYTSRLTPGLYVGSPGNTKPLGMARNPKTREMEPIQRAFVVFLQNTAAHFAFYELTIVKQSADLHGSWRQFDRNGPTAQIQVRIPPRSTLSRTVYASKADNVDTQFRVDVVEITGLPPENQAATPKANGLRTSLFFNADQTNPPIQQPDFVDDDVPQIAELETHDPVIFEPRVTAVFKPGKTTAEIKNPTEENPTEENPTEENPTEENPTEENPTEENPTEENPTEENPTEENPTEENAAIINPTEENPTEENPTEENTSLVNTAVSDGEASSATVQDIQWKVKNKGNTSSAYRFSPVVDPPAGAGNLKYQLIVSKRYYVPAVNPRDCSTGAIRVNEIISSIPNFHPRNPTEENPTEENPTEENPTEENPTEENSPEQSFALMAAPPAGENGATFNLDAGESATITLRIYDLDPAPVPPGTSPYNPPPSVLPIPNVEEQVATTVAAEAANTGQTEPASASAGPDLVLEDSGDPALAPPTVAPTDATGDTVVVSGSLKNRGTSAAIAPGGIEQNSVIETSFYLSADAVLDEGDQFLAAHQHPGTIAACSSTDQSSCLSPFAETLPVGRVTGVTRYIIVVTDLDNRVFEADNGNNTSVIPYTIAQNTLIFGQQPSDTTENVIIAPPVTVSIVDPNGGAISSDVVPSVTISIESNPPYPPGVLSGTLTRPNVGGVATFDDLRIDRPAIGYRLRAAAVLSTTAVSSEFTIGANDPPAASPDYYQATPGASFTSPTSVLANDVEPEGQPITASLASAPPAGHTVTLNPDGTFTHTPPAGFEGPVTFTYRASDGQHLSRETLVTINFGTTVLPLASADYATTFENMPVTVNVLANDGDPDGRVLRSVSVTPPGAAANAFASGAVVVAPSGLLYTMSGNRVGVVDPSSARFVQAIDIPGVLSVTGAGGDTESAIVFFSYLFRNDSGGSEYAILAIDARPASPTFNQVLATISLGETPQRILRSFAVDSVRHLLYAGITTYQAPDPSQAEVLVIDANPSSDTFAQIIATIPLSGAGGAPPQAIALNTRTNKAYVALPLDPGGLWVIDGATRTGVRVWSVPAVYSLTVLDRSNLVYAEGIRNLGGVREKSIYAVDGVTGTLLSTIFLSGSTQYPRSGRFAVDETREYVYFKTGDEDPDARLLAIDAGRTRGSFNSIVAAIPVAAELGAYSVAVDEPTGTVLATSPASITRSVTLFDGNTLSKVSDISLLGAYGVAVNPRTGQAFVAAGRGGITVISTVTRNIIATIPMGADVSMPVLVPSRHKAYVHRRTAAGSGVQVIHADGSVGAVAGLPTLNAAYPYLAADGSRERVYAANVYAGARGEIGTAAPLWIIDAASDTAIASVDAGLLPYGVAVNETTNTIYVANYTFSTAAGVQTGGITIVQGDPPYASRRADVSAFGGWVGFGREIVVNPATGKVYARIMSLQSGPGERPTAGVLDPATDVVLPLPPAFGDIRVIRVDATRNRVYLGALSGPADSQVHQVVVLDGATDAELTRLNVGFPNTTIGTSQHIAVDLGRDRLYVTDFKEGMLSVVDAGSIPMQLVTTIPVGAGPTAVVYNPVSDRVYVSNADDRTIAVIDADALSAIETVPVPIRTTAMVVDEALDTIFASGIGPDHAGFVVVSGAPANHGNLSVSIAAQPTYGSAIANDADNTILYTPQPNFYGTDSFTYSINDDRGGTATATVTVRVVHPNQPPTANDDLFSVPENTTLAAGDNGVLDNDLDEFTVILRSVLVSGPAHGTLALESSGRFTYTPATNFHGTDSFVYDVLDDDGGAARATATITVTPTYIAAQAAPGWAPPNNTLGPISSADGTLDALMADVETGYIYFKEQVPGGVRVSRYMAGTTAVVQRGYPLEQSQPSGMLMGASPTQLITGLRVPGQELNSDLVLLDENGSSVTRLVTLPWAIDPLGNGTGQQQFTRDHDGRGAFFWDNTQAALYWYGQTLEGAQVRRLFALDTGTLPGEHSATQHNDVAYDLWRGTVFLSDATSNSIWNAVPPIGDPHVAFAGLPGPPSAIAADYTTGKVFAQIGTSIYGGSPEDGTMQLVANVPDLRDIAVGRNWIGSGTSLYALTGTHLYELRSAGDAPVARDDTFSVLEGDTAILPVLANDSEPWGAPLTIVGYSGPGDGLGTVAPGADRRTLQYTPPDADFTGTVTFIYRVAGFGPYSTATVTLNIRPLNDYPVANADYYQIAAGATLAIAAPGVLANDTDADGPEQLIAEYVPDSGPVGGTFSGLSPDGAFTYSNPTPGWYWFQYRASDGLTWTQNVVSIRVTDPLRIDTVALPERVLFDYRSDRVVTQGGYGTVTVTAEPAGSLPPGVSLDSYGWFTGQPLDTGVFSFTVRATDSSFPTPQTATRTFDLRVSAPDQDVYAWSTESQTPFGAVSARELAQVITTGVAGELTAIRLSEVSCPEGTEVTVSVQGVTGTYPQRPDGTELARSQGVPGSLMPLSPAVWLPAETPLAIVISAGPADCQVHNAPEDDWYHGGAAWSRASGGTWGLLSALEGKSDIPLGTAVMPVDLEYPAFYRGGHAATKLTDGRVLITGGGTAEAEIYDPATNTFASAGTMTASRRNHTATLLGDGRVLIVGGDYYDPGLQRTVYLSSAEIFDPGRGSFTFAGSMSVPRSWHTATLLADGRVLVAGGMAYDELGQNVYSLDAEIFDGSAFVPAGVMTSLRWSHAATLLGDGRVLLSGGAGSGISLSAELFNPTPAPGEPAFRPTASNMRVFRMYHTATALDATRVLIAGGTGIWPDLATSYEIYDAVTDTFEDGGPMAVPRQEHAATPLSDGSVLLTGGVEQWGTPFRRIARAERYTPGAGATAAHPMQVTRDQHTATALNDGRVLIVGGWSDARVTPRSAELYDPSAAAFVITTGSLPDGDVGVQYPATTLQTTGGMGDITFELVSGGLPDGLTLAANGTIGGTPEAAGPMSFMVRAVSSTVPPQIATQVFTIRISRLVITTTTLPRGAVNQPYATQLQATGWGTKTWTTAFETVLPSGLSLGEDGTISGTPTETGGFWFTVLVTDSVGQTATQGLYLLVDIVAPLALTTPPVEGILFEGGSLPRLQATGGFGSYTFALAPGSPALPRGLSLNSDGSFAGVPEEVGTFAPVMQVADSSSPRHVTTGTLSLRVSAQDQRSWSQFSPNSQPLAFGPESNRRLAQVFTSGVSAPLAAVLPDGVTCAPGTDVTVTIEGVAGYPARPNGFRLATGRGTPAWPIAVFPAVFLPAESPFAVVLGTDGPGDCTALANIAEGYAAGEGWSAVGAGAWELLRTTYGLYDVRLSTLVMPSDLSYTALQRHAWGGTATTLGGSRVLLIGAGRGHAEIYDPSTGEFSAAGTLHFPRTLHTATLLPDGRVLVAGGWWLDPGRGRAYLDNAELFDPNAEPGSRFTLLTGGGMLPRAEHSATLLPGGEQVLLAGGEWYREGATDWEGQQEAQFYNISTGRFTSAGMMAAMRSGHTATLLQDGSVLFVGGYLYGRSLTTAELYLPGQTPSFRATSGPAPAYRFEHTATRLNTGSVLLAGGAGAWPDLISSYEIYDPDTETFENAGLMGVARTAHTATLLDDGSVLIAGGATRYGTQGREGWTSRVERFLPEIGIVAAAPMQVTRAYHFANALADGMLLFAGGSSGAWVTGQSAEEYDSAPGRFAIQTPALPDGSTDQDYATSGLDTTGSAATFRIAAGALADGLTLDSLSGAINGRPTRPGSFSFVVEATESSPGTDITWRLFNIVVDRPIVTTTTLPDAAVGAPYAVQLEGTGTGTLTWTLAQFYTLPDGLSLSASGLISGSPTTGAGWSYGFVVQMTDGSGQTAYQRFRLQIN